MNRSTCIGLCFGCADFWSAVLVGGVVSGNYEAAGIGLPLAVVLAVLGQWSLNLFADACREEGGRS